MIPSKPTQQYIPRVYGFKVNKSSLYYKNNYDDSSDQRQIEPRDRSSGSSKKKNRSR
jgi:hypothetical protein